MAIVLDTFKAIFILYMALFTEEDPLMIVGNAVASSIHIEDASTIETCLASISDTAPPTFIFAVLHDYTVGGGSGGGTLRI